MLKDIKQEPIDKNMASWNKSKNKCQERAIHASKKAMLLELLQNKFIDELERKYGSSVTTPDPGDIIFTIASFLSEHQYFLNLYELENMNARHINDESQKEQVSIKEVDDQIITRDIAEHVYKSLKAIFEPENIPDRGESKEGTGQ